MDCGYTTDDILSAIHKANMQLWLIDDRALAVTEIVQYPQFKTLSIKFVAGDRMERWFDEMISALSDFSKNFGCKYLEAYGRKGWAKYAKSRMKVEEFTMLRSEIDYARN